MSDVRTTAGGSVFWPVASDQPRHSVPARREETAGGISRGLVVAGVVLALGYFAWRHFGSDLRRYIKMERM